MTSGVDKVSSTSFWSILSIVAACIGGLLFVMMSHANTPKHSGAAKEEAVSSLEVKVERVATKVDNNRYILEEVKDDLRDMRAEQNTYTEAVLEAIERNGH